MNRIKGMAPGIGAITAAAMLINIAPAQAQQTELEALRAQIQELQGRLEKIEAEQIKTTDASKAAPPVSAKFPLTVSGLLQVHSLNYFNQSNQVAAAPDTFRLRRGELKISGQITPRIVGSVMIDPAKASLQARVAAIPAVIPPGGIPAANAPVRARDNVLQEIMLSYMLNKNTAGTNSNYVDIGQYKIPIGYESLQSSSALPLIERSLMFTQRDPFDAGYGDVRDTGIQLRGTRGQLDYRIGVFNGLGDRQNTLALVDTKAILGRLAFKPNGIKGLEIGVSGGRGNTGTGTGIKRADRDLFNLFAAYKKDKFSLQTEYLTGDSQNLNGTGQRDIKGYYGQVGYLFTPKLEGIFRYDYLNANRQAAAGIDSEVRDLILGVNYYIKGNNAKIQTNLVRRSGANGLFGAGAAGGVSTDIVNDRTELRTSFQVAF